MELIEYIRIIKQYKVLALQILGGVIIIALAISFVFSQQQQAVFSLIIRPKVIEKTEGFQFTDVLEASDRVTRMTQSWLKEEGLDIGIGRLGNQFLKVSFSTSDETFAKERMASINKNTNEFLSSLSPSGGLGSFEAVTSDFVFGAKDPRWILSISAGVILGIMSALFGVFLKYYLAKR